jgi:hypothetical protein
MVADVEGYPTSMHLAMRFFCGAVITSPSPTTEVDLRFVAPDRTYLVYTSVGSCGMSIRNQSQVEFRDLAIRPAVTSSTESDDPCPVYFQSTAAPPS